MERAEKLSVLLVDDHSLFRVGTRLIIDQFNEVGDIEEAEGGEHALEVLSKRRFDIMLLDLHMPVMDGKQTAEAVIIKYPDLKIIMLSSHDSLDTVSEMIELGIHSYLIKDASPEELRKAIVSVINNEFYYNQLVSRALRKRIEKKGVINQENVAGTNEGISPREAEILQLICQELTMKEIGERLYLSEQTIHTHRKNLMKKTKAKNAVGLVKFALQKGIATF